MGSMKAHGLHSVLHSNPTALDNPDPTCYCRIGGIDEFLQIQLDQGHLVFLLRA